MIIKWIFIWTNLNPLHPRMLCAKFGWNWPSGSGEENKNVYHNDNNKDNDEQRTDLKDLCVNKEYHVMHEFVQK